MKKTDLVILAGGKGSRIKKYLRGKPKPMIKFNNKFFLSYIINNFSKYDFKNIYLLTGYRHKIIFDNFHKKKYNFILIKCLNEKKPLGTGGALNSLRKIKNLNDFILINGDTFFDINPNDLIKIPKKNDLGCVSLLKRNRDLDYNIKLNNLGINNEQLIFSKSRKFINGGVYYFKKKILNYIPKNYSSLENEILPELIIKNKIKGKVFNNFFIDIGSKKFLKTGAKILRKFQNKPAVFLDRDGVINHDLNYVYKKKDFKFKKGVLKSLRYISSKNYYIFIVTNQAGIAKGKFNISDFEKLHIYLKKNFLKNNIYINDVKFSPYHPRAKIKKFKKKTSLRKPGNLMIKQIFKNWDINKKKSFMIGDNIKDQKSAKKSQLYFEFVEKNFLSQIKRIIKKKINNY